MIGEWMMCSIGGMIQGNTKVLVEKPVLVLLCLPEIHIWTGLESNSLLEERLLMECLHHDMATTIVISCRQNKICIWLILDTVYKQTYCFNLWVNDINPINLCIWDVSIFCHRLVQLQVAQNRGSHMHVTHPVCCP